MSGDLGQRTGQLRAGRSSADHHESQPAPSLGLVRLELRALERHQNAAADLERVFDGLEARRVLAPAVVAEVGVGGAGGDDEEVVVHRAAAGENDATAVHIDALGLRHQHPGVLLPPEDLTDRRPDVDGAEAGRGHLVEQGLEKMVVVAVDQGDSDRRPRQRLGGVEPGEASAQDHHLGSRLGHRLRNLASRPSLPSLRPARLRRRSQDRAPSAVACAPRKQ